MTTHPTTLIRLPATLASIVALGLIGAGCGSSDTDSASSGQAATHQSKAAKFAQCMRDNGVKDFPDPDASGELTIDGVLNGSSLDPNGPAWKSAYTACKELQPPGFTGHKANSQEQSTRLKFAQCIRDNGVRDFPDPTEDSPLIDTNKIPSANTSDGMSLLHAAMRACGKTFAGRLGLRK